MAASNIPLGYQCQFLDSVPEDLYCKQCSLVARKLTITSCCGESYCNGCIHSIQQDNKLCPECGEERLEIYPQPKYQKKIMSLQTYCPLKERGCGWCGRLEQLEAHLDLDEGDCEYADIHCPLKCHHKITRKDVTHHIANECVKRDYICPYCSFKAIYEIVCNIHWPECSYYPLPCPNRCGVTCERPTMEDHMKICPLEEVECEFKHVGCAAKFRREEEEEHMREKSQTHLTMMATTSLKMEQEFQRKLQEQEKRLEERFQEKLVAQMQDFVKVNQEFQTKLQEQEKRFKEHEKRFEEHEKRFEEKIVLQKKEFEGRLQEKEEQLQKGNKQLETLQRVCCINYKFTMENFSVEKAKDTIDKWKGPTFSTHVCGYKFCIGIDANGCDESQFNSVNVELWAMMGVYDDQLEWPVKARITIELINHYPNGDNKRVTTIATWDQPERKYIRVPNENGGVFNTDPKINYCFIKHSKLSRNAITRTHYLKDDTLHFNVNKITVL